MLPSTTSRYMGWGRRGRGLLQPKLSQLMLQCLDLMLLLLQDRGSLSKLTLHLLTRGRGAVRHCRSLVFSHALATGLRRPSCQVRATRPDADGAAAHSGVGAPVVPCHAAPAALKPAVLAVHTVDPRGRI
jgi:hypothetical protein